MCGIVGIFGKKDAAADIVRGLSVLKERGRDGVGIFNDREIHIGKKVEDLRGISGNNIIAHALHSVVSIVPQPIKKKGVLVSNCEIYNWQELKERYGLQSGNDSELLIDLIEAKGLLEAVKILDGDYAFAYWHKDEIYVVRDIVGVKPVWFSLEKGFAFASERKALEQIGYANIEELNPRTIACYNLKKGSFIRIRREFFRIGKMRTDNVIEKTEELLLAAVKKRIPDKKLGILFSGGIDSTMLALLCKKLGKEFICYTAVLEERGMGDAPDLVYAKKVAAELGFNLKIKKLDLKETEQLLATVVPLIEDSNVVKVGVALPFYAACEQAQKDGIKVMFSGLGSEEIFAGYERHKKSQDINKECLSGLLKMYERDLYRDDVVTMHNNIELRVPFLDKELIAYALSIPGDMKISGDRNKIVLREIAKRCGIPDEYAERKKKAAQYGSKFDRALEKLAHRAHASKSRYLQRFYQRPNNRLGVLWSTGKDSALATWIMVKQNYEIGCLISLKSSNPDSFMFHTPTIDLAPLQAESMGVPLVIQETRGEKEKELADLKAAILKAKNTYHIQGIVTGALYSNYQRERIEKICDSLELKIFAPLWHVDQEQELHTLLTEGFSAIITKVAAAGLGEKWLGREIDEKAILELAQLHTKYRINVAGEGGETESLVLKCPLFSKKLKIVEAEKVMDTEYSGFLRIKKAILI